MGPASMYDSVRVIPPERSDSPAGSQPNVTLATSGLNWRGAAGPAAGGPAPAERELGIDPRGARLTVGYLVEQLAYLGLSHGRSLLVGVVLPPAGPASCPGPSAR